jgi:LysR family transcriptional regulator, glycine cleavage system transcriptional activator
VTSALRNFWKRGEAAACVLRRHGQVTGQRRRFWCNYGEASHIVRQPRIPITALARLSKTARINRGIASAKLRQGNQRRLPPLNAVRAFEAAARLGGFSTAGAELNVSANAVGRLVKLLEDWLGVALFRRLPRGVVVTDAGGHYLARVGTLLDQLAEATTDLQRLETSRVLTVSAAPSFVSRWLILRLGRLTQRHPELDVRVVVSVTLTDFTREEVDVAVRHGTGSYEGLCSDLLMPEDFFPVCSPALLARAPPLREPADLVHHALLHDRSDRCLPGQLDWARWLTAMGMANIDAQRGVQFSYAHMALEAAASGQGVALANSAFLGDDLAAGRLVRPFGDLTIRGPYGTFIVCPKATAEREQVAMFRDWAIAEVAKDG